MNPDSVFREVLESQEFRSSDTLNPAMILNCFAVYFFASDNVNLLDIAGSGKAGRFADHIVDESAVRG